jgi:hypothetical protein
LASPDPSSSRRRLMLQMFDLHFWMPQKEHLPPKDWPPPPSPPPPPAGYYYVPSQHSGGSMLFGQFSYN